jgi:hypothetical protein
MHFHEAWELLFFLLFRPCGKKATLAACSSPPHEPNPHLNVKKARAGVLL